MPTLRIMRGYPASGKTTLARSWVAEEPERRARVNRDDLRASLYDGEGVLSFSQEQQVSKVEQAQVLALLKAGLDVVVDDTNLRLKYARAWADLARSASAGFEVVDVPTDAATCVEWDVARRAEGKRSVGEQVIRTMAEKFPLKRWPKVEASVALAVHDRTYTPDPLLPGAWIVDIDGTLANHHGIRDPYDTSLYYLDTVHEAVRDVVISLRIAGYRIVVTSGRSEAFRAVTAKWLSDNEIPCHDLVMRAEGDLRKDDVVKAELFWGHVAPKWAVQGCIDDRDRVVAMWRALGLVCLQAAPGAF